LALAQKRAKKKLKKAQNSSKQLKTAQKTLSFFEPKKGLFEIL
jgi:hypothetical protein